MQPLMSLVDQDRPGTTTTVGLVNHACLAISTPHAVVLSDPWISGSAFDDGWDFLLPSVMPPLADDPRPVFVWYSHEHPDHFSPGFLKHLDPAVRARTTVLYQRAGDHRVADFCRSVGVQVMELDDGVAVDLVEGVRVTCGFVWEYDSWLLVESPGMRMLNLNDCRLTDEALRALAARVGTIDVLATQFSYASWKGGPEHTELRRHYAREKLRQVETQITALRPAQVIPFASFVYFSHVENRYMNDAVNRIDDVVPVITAAGAEPVVLAPGDEWVVGTRHRGDAAVTRWREAFDLDRQAFRDSPDVAAGDLASAATEFCRTLRRRNNRLFLALLRYAPVGGFLRPITIELIDHPGERLTFSAWKGLRPGGSGEADIRLHSSSLRFVFSRQYGFDTLLVNGRFEATSDGFRRVSRMFGITIINHAGRTIGWRAMKDYRYFAALLGTVRSFNDNADAAERGAALSPA